MSIDDLLAHLDDVPPEQIPTWLSRLAAAQGVLAARLLNGNGARPAPKPEGGRLLTAQQAAEKTGVSADWFYRRSNSLPFAVRLGRSLRFSESGLEKWFRSRT